MNRFNGFYQCPLTNCGEWMEDNPKIKIEHLNDRHRPSSTSSKSIPSKIISTPKKSSKEDTLYTPKKTSTVTSGKRICIYCHKQYSSRFSLTRHCSKIHQNKHPKLDNMPSTLLHPIEETPKNETSITLNSITNCPLRVNFRVIHCPSSYRRPSTSPEKRRENPYPPHWSEQICKEFIRHNSHPSSKYH